MSKQPTIWGTEVEAPTPKEVGGTLLCALRGVGMDQEQIGTYATDGYGNPLDVWLLFTDKQDLPNSLILRDSCNNRWRITINAEMLPAEPISEPEGSPDIDFIDWCMGETATAIYNNEYDPVTGKGKRVKEVAWHIVEIARYGQLVFDGTCNEDGRVWSRWLEPDGSVQKYEM